MIFKTDDVQKLLNCLLCIELNMCSCFMEGKNMNHAGVIFDTNVYRTITGLESAQRIFLSLINQEKMHDINGYANPYVIMELSAHLANRSDASFMICYESIKLLAHHCLGNHKIRIAADSESFLCDFVCGRSLKSAEDNSMKLGALCSHIYRSSDVQLSEFDDLLTEIALKVDNIETRFVQDMFTYVVGYYSGSSNDWNALKKNQALRSEILSFLKSEQAINQIARAFVIKGMHLCDENASQAYITKKTEELIITCLSPIRLYIEILSRIAMSGCDLTKRNRPNWIWDMNIAFAIGNNLTIDDNREIYLVTNDNDILQAGKDSGMQGYILSIEEYFYALGLGSDI